MLREEFKTVAKIIRGPWYFAKVLASVDSLFLKESASTDTFSVRVWQCEKQIMMSLEVESPKFFLAMKWIIHSGRKTSFS